MALIDRINQLDKHESYEELAEKAAQNVCKNEVHNIECRIKAKDYKIVNGMKQIDGGAPLVIYSIGENRNFIDSPHYIFGYDGDPSQYHVNNEYEARYLVDSIVKKLKKEGCICKVEKKSNTRSNGYGFWDSLFKGTTTTYIYHVSYVFTWKN